MHASCMHGRDLGKLISSQKWPMPPPQIPTPAKDKRVVGDQLKEVTKKSTVNKYKVVIQI